MQILSNKMAWENLHVTFKINPYYSGSHFLMLLSFVLSIPTVNFRSENTMEYKK